MIEFLKWDSEFLGIQTGKLILDHLPNFEHLVEIIQKEQFKLLYIFVDPLNENLNRILKNNGVLLADKKQTYLQSIFTSDLFILPNIVNIHHLSNELITLAFESGVYSRFKIDTNFAENTYEKLYEIWIRKSVEHVIAEQVWGYFIDNKIVGMVTFAQKGGRGDIGLLAVNENYRGLGIGIALINKVKSYCNDNKISELQVITQGDNNPAISLYLKTGFALEKQINIYHYWV